MAVKSCASCRFIGNESTKVRGIFACRRYPPTVAVVVESRKVRPISGHKTLAQTRTYNKATAEKGRRIALKRREHIDQLGEREGGKASRLGSRDKEDDR
jgi:hypothetical protein